MERLVIHINKIWSSDPCRFWTIKQNSKVNGKFNYSISPLIVTKYDIFSLHVRISLIEIAFILLINPIKSVFVLN